VSVASRTPFWLRISDGWINGSRLPHTPRRIAAAPPPAREARRSSAAHTKAAERPQKGPSVIPSKTGDRSWRTGILIELPFVGLPGAHKCTA
jgi:hypothetical protein